MKIKRNKMNFEYKYGNPYKLKTLTTYLSNDSIYNPAVAYRKVFERSEITYLRFHLSFYNKLFDEENWEAKIKIKSYKITNTDKILICSLDKIMTIDKTLNVVEVNNGWGSPTPGEVWQKGKYILEAYVNDNLIGSTKFFVNDIDLVTEEQNPYFKLLSLKMLEGNFELDKPEPFKYLSQFNGDKTRYVWFEINIEILTDEPFFLEMFIDVFHESGQLKTHISKTKRIEENEKGTVYTLYKGWGNDQVGTWSKDSYSVKLKFMEQIIAHEKFKVASEEIELNSQANQSQIEPQSIDDILAKLNKLIGLESMKKQIRGHVDYIDFLNIRRNKGIQEDTSISLHSVFTGNPGTGKTTIVKMLGEIYHKKGLLSNGHVHEVDRSDLIGEFIGQTAPATKEAIKKAQGGILFIDEAYTLYRKSAEDYGKEAIEILIKEMEKKNNDIAIMFAGYPNETMQMINSNPGLKSRINHFFHFEDYTPDELLRIAESNALNQNLNLSKEAKNKLAKIITEEYRNRDNTFGNARFAISIVNEAKMNMGIRLMKNPDIKNLTKEELSQITVADIDEINISKEVKKEPVAISQDTKLLKEALAELNSLTGLEEIKTEINELVKLTQYYNELGKNSLNKLSIHTVFTGNPGTGKTTIARIMGKIYKSLGILERGHLVEVGRDALVAGFVGQTAIKTKEVIQKAMGGILFIDEAYSLTQSNDSKDYGNEAIDIILKEMEDNRGKFAIIVAGYPNEMTQFLKTNPGLKSRFDKVIHFHDYKPKTLMVIAKSMLKKQDLYMTDEATEYIQGVINEIYTKRDKSFANARVIRKLTDQAIRRQNLRMANTPKEERTPEMQQTLIIDDLKGINPIDKIKIQNSLGF